jgi:hypothetical protein
MKFGPAAILLLGVGAWPSLREELPTLRSSPTSDRLEAIPVVVVPAPIDAPAVPTHSDNPVAHVTAAVHGGLRDTRLVAAMGNEVHVGDLIYLSCTPRDADGERTDSHGPLQAWLVSGDAARALTDADTFHADLRARGPGDLSVACRVDDVTSAPIRFHVDP